MKEYWNDIISMDNLKVAHYRARQDKEHYAEVRMVDSDPDRYLKEIHNSLINGTYEIHPEDYTISVIHDRQKERELRKLNYYPHRIIQWAIMLQIQPTFIENFCYHTCASIPGRGGNHARLLLLDYLKKDVKYCLKIDITKYYDHINHDILKHQIRRIFQDKPLLKILDNIIESNPGGVGVPIGSYVSQFLANFYLTEFDQWLIDKGEYVVRYMDDVVIVHKSKRHLQKLLVEMEQYLTDLKLTVKANKQIFPIAKRGIDFIGYRFFPGYVLLRKSTCVTLKQCCTRIFRKLNNHKLLSKREFCSINSYIGWLKHCNSHRLKQKYIYPVIPKLIEYYCYVIHNSTSVDKKSKKVKKYINRLIHNLNE